MKFLTLENIKAHSRIDYDCEDTLLELYGDSAEETVTQYLNRGKTTDEMVANLTAEFGKVPTPIYQAALMLVDVSYQHRSPVSAQNMSVVPYTFDLLLKPYVIL